jgi:lipoprotein-anchoring transpeptidase ErfK/SrfK
MNTLYGTVLARFAACLLALALINPGSQTAWANTRQMAVTELDRLHQSASNRKLTDELKSVDATFAIAEHYFQTKDVEQSESFYLLTIQKARIILASLQNTAAAEESSPETMPPAEDGSTVPEPETAEPDAPQQAPPASPVEPPSSPDVEPSPPDGTQDFGTPTPEPEAVVSPDEVTSERLVGTVSTYYVVKDDTIRLVAAKLGVSQQHLIRKNRLDVKTYLKIGQKLSYNNRKIVPQRMKDGIVVNIPDRTLYYFKQGKLAVSLPVALGVPVKSDKYDWKTPVGKFRVTAKMKDPTWHVPPSIQSEMEDQGKEVITSIPPGPANPLGKYAIKTSIPGILIHSTTKPWSIYSFASHGCIRVYPEQMEEFFKEVTVNTRGEIIYKPVKLAITEVGRVFLEVHRDVYSMSSSGLATEARRLIEKQNLSGRVDWQKVESIVRRTAGIAEDITL